MKSLILSFAFIVLLGSQVAVAIASAPRHGGPVIVFARSADAAARIVDASGGYRVGWRDLPFAVHAAGTDVGFRDRLTLNGAIGVVSAFGWTGLGCLT